VAVSAKRRTQDAWGTLAGDVAAVALGEHVLADGPDVLSCDDPRADRRLDGDLELKSKTRGYASLDWKADGDEVSELVKVDLLLQGERVDALARMFSRAMIREPIAAWTGTSNCWRGMSSRSLFAMARSRRRARSA
jgi:hypothetical protein